MVSIPWQQCILSKRLGAPCVQVVVGVDTFSLSSAVLFLHCDKTCRDNIKRLTLRTEVAFMLNPYPLYLGGKTNNICVLPLTDRVNCDIM